MDFILVLHHDQENMNDMRKILYFSLHDPSPPIVFFVCTMELVYVVTKRLLKD